MILPAPPFIYQDEAKNLLNGWNMIRAWPTFTLFTTGF